MNNKIVAAIVFMILLVLFIAINNYGIINYDLLTFLIFISFIGVLMYADKNKVKLEGIVFIRKTTKGRNFIDNIAKRNPYIWKTLSIIGVIISIPILIIGSLFLLTQSYAIISGAKEGGVKLLLPGPVSTPVNMPGIFVVPWWIWVIGVAAVVIPHEFFHGITCRLNKIKIKSVGWLLLFIIPGAFVEPNEKQLKKSKRLTKLKVYAAGSLANILVALILFILLMFSFSTMLTQTGVFVPIENMTGLMILEINGTVIRNQNDFYNTLSKFNINDTFQAKVITNGYFIPKFQLDDSDFFIPKPAFLANNEDIKNYNITLTRNPEKIETISAVKFNLGHQYAYLYYSISLIFLWIFIFSLGVGLVNLLPIKPLDGGLIFEEIVGKFTRKGKIIAKIVSIFILFLLLFNLFGPVFV
ncbi:MAG: site-2 protease family protein [Candidatus Aenigmatarchaeota archaeon]